MKELSEFRDRLIAHGLEELVLDRLLERVGELGLLRAGGRQRTDSTHVLAAVRMLNRMEFVGETLRAALETLAVAAPGWLRQIAAPQWFERYGKRDRLFPLPQRDRRPSAVGAGGGRGRIRTASGRLRTRCSGLAAGGRGGAGPACCVGAAIPP
ncbi:hypothetical protein ACFW3D_38110 [Streptomyces sp. NPDC058864]